MELNFNNSSLNKKTENYTLDIEFLEKENEYFKVKIWRPNTSNNHEFVKALWLNEARQLSKLKTANNASKYIEIIHDYFVKDGCFYLIYKSNPSYKSLYKVIDTEARISLLNSNKHWLHADNVLNPINKVYFWKNILRLVHGLEILHSRGIIHRNISKHSIIYNKSNDYANDEKFILAGFEKSLDFNKPKWVEFDNYNNIIYTTHQDWHDLATFILDILGVEDNWTDSSKLSNKEKKIIAELKKGVSTRKMHKGVASLSSLKLLIESCVDFHSIIMEERDNLLHISITKKFEEIVYEQVRETLNAPEITIPEIKNILKQDLDISPFKIFGNTRNKPDGKRTKYFLQGRQFTYKIREFKFDKYPFKSMMVIEGIVNDDERLISRLARINGEKVRRCLKYIGNPYSLDPKYRKESNAWDEVLSQLNKQIPYKNFELECLQGLLMSIAVGQSLMSIQRYRIRLKKVDKAFIEKYPTDFIVDDKLYFFVSIKESDNKINSNLSKAIGHKEACTRFVQSLQEENNVGDGWIARLEQKAEDDVKDNHIRLQFHKQLEDQYIFVESDENKSKLQVYGSQVFLLYPSDITGTEFQIKRQVQIFRHLLLNMPLAKSLSRPADSAHVTLRDYDISDILNSFDESKEKIFKPLITTYPNYYIEGPPGVGKTYLITNYVNHLFAQEDSTKILLSAQAHATVKLLYKSTLKALQDNNFLEDMVIISDFKDVSELQRKTSKTPSLGIATLDEDSEGVGKRYEIIRPFLEDFTKSPLFQKYIKEGKISEKLQNFTINAEDGFYKAIIKAANLIFTTSNSALMASLVSNEVSFDVSIMEESAKASGIEMVGSMLVANKRVMIGDAKQLPAFSEGVVESVVENASCEDVKNILAQLKETNLTKLELTQLDVSYKDTNGIEQEYANEMLANLQRYFPLFKSLCEDARSTAMYVNFGGMLNIQHRMHPDICNIISETVYDGELITDSSRLKKAKQNNFRFNEAKARLAGLNKENAVIWVDIPDIKTNQTLKSLEMKNTNKTEVKIIYNLKNSISREDEDAYSLKILSPYLNQVKKLNQEIEEGIAHTVDSFQGNEADVVIVSLVRHNINPTIRQALGFLVEMRRMNVLLSRAKHKLIIVGCFGLFKTWLAHEKQRREKSYGVLSEDNFEFLDKFVTLLESDYQTMMDDSCEISDKKFVNVNFVSAKEYVGL